MVGLATDPSTCCMFGKGRPLKLEQLMNNVRDKRENACEYSRKVSVIYVRFLTESLTLGAGSSVQVFSLSRNQLLVPNAT